MSKAETQNASSNPATNAKPESPDLARVLSLICSYSNRPDGAISCEKHPCSSNRTVLLSISLRIRTIQQLLNLILQGF
uniref:Putative ovule protein n=1 Tax=Solanum chacoense TaxID=4108 RepID=A0A0V0IJD7_SOLCH